MTKDKDELNHKIDIEFEDQVDDSSVPVPIHVSETQNVCNLSPDFVETSV